MTADAELRRIRSKHRPAPGDAALLHRIRYGIWRHRMPIVAVLLSVVVTGGMLGYLVRVMSRERNTPLLVNVTARQRTLVERYIKDVVLKLDGVPTAPEASATVMVASADALLRGGMVVSPNGDPERLVHVPAVRGWKAQAKLTQERGLINELTDRGSALLAEGRQSPTYATDLRLLRILGAELSSVTSDATNEITLDAHSSLSRLEVVAVLAGVIGALLSCVVIVVLRRAAQRASARFRTLVHNSTDMITVVGDDGETLYQSPAIKNVLGYAVWELEGADASQLVHPSDLEQLFEQLMPIADQHGATSTVQYRARHRDGSWRDLEGTATNLAKDKTVGGFVINVRDVTDRNRAQEALAAARDQAMEGSRLKSQFLATMSHEIRTPMNAVIGLTELLLDTRLDPEPREYAAGVQVAAEGLLGIINDILDFSKIEAGRVEIEQVDMDLGLVVEGVAGLLGDVASGKGIELIGFCEPDVPRAVRGDPVRLRQVLLNLVSNAVKFTSDGEVVLRVRRLDETPDAINLRFEVRDTGIGIAREDQQRLFEPFSQADASTTRRFGGTGLGLAITKELVEMMGGTLEVESEVDAGSTFSFALTLPKQAGAGPTFPVQELGSLRVLVVDDNATNRLILRQQLRSWGMEPAEAANGLAALEALRGAAGAGQAFDLVILDYHMPGMDGLDLAAQIVADASIARARLFLLSSSAQRLGREAARSHGLSGSLTKPVRQSELFNLLLSGINADGALLIEETEARPRPRARAPRMDGAPVLLVEDNSMNQLVASRILDKLGYRVDIAGNGREALAALAERAYAAVLMDCQMPEMDGYDATRELRRREGDGDGADRRTPVIAMTAAAMDGDREACLAAGMDDYITKPVRSDAIAGVLSRWIRLGTPSAHEPSSPPAERHTADTHGSVLESARLATLRELDGGDGELLALLADEYARDARTQLDRLAAALAEGDPHTVERTAHALKGASDNIGASRLGELCRELESHGRAAALGSGPALLQRIQVELDRVLEALGPVVKRG
jgi:two-component system, sensor histidine kinase and response regulator